MGEGPGQVCAPVDGDVLGCSKEGTVGLGSRGSERVGRESTGLEVGL